MEEKTRNIAFFTRSGGSAQIRGRQISEYLGAKLNPVDGYRDDVCVFVKYQPDRYPENSYLDIIDEHRRVKWLKEHPDIGVIASSLTGYEFLCGKLKNKTVLIPQHHCNYDREARHSRERKIAGVIGGAGAMQLDIKDLKRRFRNAGMKFVMRSNYRKREDVVDFYKTIDVQVVWRPQARPLKNPLKIINAASFGIPTVAYPEVAYREVEGYYARALSIPELVEKARAYDNDKLVEKAEEYHIENISKLYLSL